MKNSFWKGHFAGWFGFALVATSVPLAHGATLTVSPSSTSNTYAGVITLQIGGLTNTEAVVVQEYLDLNANGTADATEPLVDTFPIADGGVSTIGGKTNLNVPFDTNPTASNITTTIFFSPPLAIENIVGQHIFRVVSPTGRFTAVNATFTVTNAALNQTLTGTVFRAGSPATNAVVIVLNALSGGVAGGVIADSAGRYAIRLPTNSYQLIATYPNAFTDMAAAPQVTLTNGMTATNNLFLTNGTVTLSGTTRDATNSSGLGGVMLLFESGNYLSVAFSDSNGTYSAALSSSFWKLDVEEERLLRRGYVLPAQKPQYNLTTGAVANANVSFPKANAMFYGRLTNHLGVPLANVRFDANDGQGGDSSMFQGRGFSDANGYYSVAVLAGTNQWYCSPDTAGAPALANYIFSQGQSVLFSNTQTFQLNFTALPTTAKISGQVKDNAGNPVAGVLLGGNANIGGLNYSSANVDTDNSGNYSFGVAPGQWYVQFTSGDDSSENLNNRGLVDLYGPYPVTIPPTNATQNITVFPTGSAVIGPLELYGGGYLGLNITGTVSTTYTLQVCTDATLTNWSPLTSFQLTGNPFQILDTDATNVMRYYRLLKN
ncbi:MAG: carboxypeptidase regulatory-like domain-containing protein [Pedosphaera sp.]|nr:carboxypeptidase regulatory-like domain-containing protein [Pedosphaera sp.]